MRSTHTYSILEISTAAFEEIKGKLLEAGYDHAVHDDGDGSPVKVDMHGIAVCAEACAPVTAGAVLRSSRFHLYATIAWAVATVPACVFLAEGAFQRVLVFVSFYALVTGHWGSYQAARSEEKQ